MKREDVEALRQKIAVADAGGWGFVSVRPQMLSALLDIAEAVQDAPVAHVSMTMEGDAVVSYLHGAGSGLTGSLTGKQVRLVAWEVGE